jgi:plastocyanin
MLGHSRKVQAWMLAMGVAVLLMASDGRTQPGNAPAGAERAMQETVLQWGYLQSQYAAQNPPDILGSLLRISIRQDSGGVRVILPDCRQGSEPITSVPDLSQGRFALQVLDATVTDAGRARDTVDFQASWNDPQGTTYAVRCGKVLSRSIAHPVSRGIVGNHVRSGLDGRGVPATPTGCTCVAFRGMGDALKNGRVVARSIMVQGALTEALEGYRSTTGEPVLVLRRQFHVLVMLPSLGPGPNAAAQHNVSAGETFGKDEKPPYWHVVFDNPQVAAAREPAMSQSRFTRRPQGGPDFGSAAAQNIPHEAAVVEMTNALRYVPREIKIAVGQTVKWRNTSHFTHTVTCDPSLAGDPRDVQLPEGAEPFNSGVMRPGAAFRYTFTTPGRYKYFCIPHEYADMVGTVEVIGQP